MSSNVHSASVHLSESGQLTSGHPAWIGLRIYPDIESMRRAGTRYTARFGTPVGFTQAGAMFNPSSYLPSNPQAFCGVMRFYTDGCRQEQVVHESVHAACEMYRRFVQYSIRLGTGCRAREEDLALPDRGHRRWGHGPTESDESVGRPVSIQRTLTASSRDDL